MDAWLYFPYLKVGQIHLYSSFFLFGGVDWKSLHKTRNAIIPELDRRLGLFSLACFLFTQSGFKKKLICRKTTDQACFVFYLTTFSVGKQSNSKIV